MTTLSNGTGPYLINTDLNPAKSAHYFAINIGETITTTTTKGARTIHDLKWINANQKLHWGDSSPQVRSWRHAVAVAAFNADVPSGMDYAQIHGFVFKPTARIYDPANLAPTMKAIVDGLVQNYGLLPDDDYLHLDGPHLHHGGIDRSGPERIEVLILEKENPHA